MAVANGAPAQRPRRAAAAAANQAMDAQDEREAIMDDMDERGLII